MINSLTRKDNERRTGSKYHSLSNDSMNHSGIGQNYSDQNQLSPPVLNNISGDDSDEENDDTDGMVPMDITEVIESVTVPTDRTAQLEMNSMTKSSSSPSNFPICGHRTMSSNTTYQPKCASTATSAERYRQWQILGGGFGESYDILLPEEGEIDEESENESEEEKDFENDVNNFFEQIISVHVRRPPMKEGGHGTPSSFLKCNCLRPNCRIRQYLGKNVMSDTIKEGKQLTPPASSKSLYTSRNLPSEYSTNSSSSNILSDNLSSNSEQTTGASSSTMLNTVLKHKNNLNLPSEKQHGKPDAHAYTKLKTQHHTTSNQNYDEKSSQVIKKCQKQYHNHNNSTRNKREHVYVSCYPMPDLPNECSIELRKVHADILQRAGGIKRVNRLFDELAFLSHCLGGWRILLENSPKDGNTLLMWLCCQPHKQQHTEGRNIRRITLDDNRFLYSKIIAVTMAMISEAYGNDTKDTKDKCLLFARNSQEASSLELASLTNKSIIACWLALLYPSFGHDVNETNQLGHSVLHLLARKGDDTADTLQELLKLRSNSNASSSTPFGRMFRLDVVNSGSKTPLDVAVTCELNGGKDERSDTQYQRVISYFHETIVEEAEEFEKRMELESHKKSNGQCHISMAKKK